MLSSSKAWRGTLFVLAVYGGSRIFYLIAGAVFFATVPAGAFQRETTDVPYGSVNIWAHWDGEHYARLASNGYLNPPNNMSPAFFPLYPLAMRSVAALLGGPLSIDAFTLWGMLVSLAVLPFAFYFVYRIAEDGWGTEVARKSLLLLAFFPATFFLNATYTESLFLALSAGAIWAARVRKDLFFACVLAGLATATRNVGIFLLVPLAYEWYRNAGYYRWQGAYLALAPSGLLIYMGYLWVRFGEPLLFYTDQQDWNRQATGPLETISNAGLRAYESVQWVFEPALRPQEVSLYVIADYLSFAINAYNLFFLIVALALLVVGLRYLPLGLLAYAFLVSVPPALFGTPETPLMGFPRYMLVAFPLFIVLGSLLKNRWAFAGWMAFSVIFSLVLTMLFITWRFVA